MPKKLWQKCGEKNTKNKQSEIKNKHRDSENKQSGIENYQKREGILKRFCLTLIMLLVNLLMPAGAIFYQNVSAVGCPDVKVIFARGSGEERWTDQNYLNFKSELMAKLNLTSLKYEFEDLDYPAVSVANPWTLLTAFVSGGEAYEFGASVEAGVKNLVNEVNNNVCTNTKFVLGGYSQGAMVLSKASRLLNADKIIYAATFGDPKLYLPEGRGAMPDACRGANLSNYRIYVPDCRAYEGMLGSYIPYQPETLVDKMGTWCNHTDIMCSSHLGVNSHISYVKDGIYVDASKLIFDKITRAFGVTNNYVSLHDTAILIDSTGSMSGLIEKYKTEALRLAEKTLTSGGRVALYDYRDLNDPYEPVEHCNFETCDLETFQAGLNEIRADGGGDTSESLLSAGLKVMKKLNWNYGSTKSVVVLTDASYHNPDLDGTTFDDVVALSKKIDPVNFYVIAPSEITGYYDALAAATGGKVATTSSDLSALTDEIVARYDSLPRVEETDNFESALPEIPDTTWEKLSDDSVKISFASTGKYTIVALNDAILGMTDSGSFTLTDLDLSQENVVTLVPLSDTVRGAGVSVEISAGKGDVEILIPKAPNTGKLK